MNVEDYLDTVSSSVESNVHLGIKELKAELVKVVQTKGLTQVTPEKIDQACDLLLRKMKTNFEKNLSKFSLYAVRNIFKENDVSVGTEAAAAALTAPSPTTAQSAVTLHAKRSDELDAEGEQLSATLDSLKRDFINLHTEYSRIITECQDMDALIKDMRETSFSVRLGLQDMDRLFEAQSLAETTNALYEYRSRLEQSCAEAEFLLRKINSAQSIEEEGDVSYFRADEQASNVDISVPVVTATADNNSIRTGSTSSLQRVTQGLQPPPGRK